jgi:F-type H+-transporting ATPase subunit gamma
MAENLSRIDHMENALQRIDEKTEDLNQQCNILRQEEIIEEIEIILLNTRLASKRHEKQLFLKDEN